MKVRWIDTSKNGDAGSQQQKHVLRDKRKRENWAALRVTPGEEELYMVRDSCCIV
jgi:hypothetical protein